LSSGADSLEAAKAAIRRELEFLPHATFLDDHFDHCARSLGANHRWSLLLAAIDAASIDNENEYEAVCHRKRAHLSAQEQKERPRVLDRLRPRLFDLWLAVHRAQLAEAQANRPPSITAAEELRGAYGEVAEFAVAVVLRSQILDDVHNDDLEWDELPVNGGWDILERENWEAVKHVYVTQALPPCAQDTVRIQEVEDITNQEVDASSARSAAGAIGRAETMVHRQTVGRGRDVQ